MILVINVSLEFFQMAQQVISKLHKSGRDRVSIPWASRSAWQRSCVDLRAALVCLWDHVSISEQCWIVHWDHFGWSRPLENSFRVSLWGKVLIFIYLNLFLFGFLHCYWRFLEDMTEVNQSTVKIVNIYQLKINVVNLMAWIILVCGDAR